MKTGVICIGDNLFEALLAISAEEQQRGLMYINPPTPNMVFIYDRPTINKFWMANTPAPLDIIFSCAGKITQICVGEPYSTSMIGDDQLSDLIVELPYGLVDKLGIKIGYNINFIKPTAIELKQIVGTKYSSILKI